MLFKLPPLTRPARAGRPLPMGEAALRIHHHHWKYAASEPLA
jgi:hypothetical protein